MNGNPSGRFFSHEYPTKIWNNSFIRIFFTSLAFNMGLFMSNSLLPVYTNSLGAPASTIGLVIGTYAVSAILFRLISAPIMDTYNRKYVVVFAALMMAAAFFGYSMSHDIKSLIVFRLLQGAAMAFGNACCMVMAAEMLPRDKYNTGMGYYALAQTTTQAIGPAAGLWLSVWLGGYTIVFAINACVMLIAAFIAFQIKINFKRTKKFRLSLNNVIAKEVLLPAAIMFMIVFGSCTVNSFLVVFAGTKGVTSNIGLFFTVSACTMLITRPLVGELTDKFGFVKVAIPALLCNVIAFFIISYSSTLLSFLLAAFISAFGQGACQPSIQALCMKAVTDERRGAASSTIFIGVDIGFLTAPIGGSIAQLFGYSVMWRIMTAPFFIAMLSMFIFRAKIMSIEETFASQQIS